VRSVRYRDPLIRSLHTLARDDILVVCPRCAAGAVVAPLTPEGRTDCWQPRRFACHACGHTDTWERPAATAWGNPVDPYFRMPLWLRVPCCGRELWAFHEKHLDLLDGWIGAKLRERGDGPRGMTLLARTPGWMTSARNRQEVLRGLRRLRQTLR
jgi:hypothetical protein